MSDPASRRGFLRSLTTLPLIGGGITLIGAPSAVAQPVTDGLLMAYNEWLFMERRMLCEQLSPAMPFANVRSHQHGSARLPLWGP